MMVFSFKKYIRIICHLGLTVYVIICEKEHSSVRIWMIVNMIPIVGLCTMNDMNIPITVKYSPYN